MTIVNRPWNVLRNIPEGGVTIFEPQRHTRHKLPLGANPGGNAVVAGYPLDAQRLHAVPARIGGIQDAQGPNIYQTATVTRQIYEIRAVVESGNSGGPLLAPDGTVYGVVFAAAVGVSNTGFALTDAQVHADAQAGERSTTAVSTMTCD